MPAALASSIAYWISGLSTTGSISFGTALVAGRMRVPRPATGNTALRTGFCMTSSIGFTRGGETIANAANGRFIQTSRDLVVQQHVARAVDLGGQVVGAAVIGVKLFHQPVVRCLDRFGIGAGREAQNRIGLVDGDVRALWRRTVARL